MIVEDTNISGIKLITPRRHGDQRGYFSEIYRADILRAHGVEIRFVQENHSYSSAKGVLRGLHFQIPPHTQAKLIRVAVGAILDVAVDIRWGSPTYGHHLALQLSADDGRQLLIPEGFAHGFCTLLPDTQVVYKVSRYYSPEHDKGLLWNDPELGIAWPSLPEGPLLSDKDRRQPLLAALPRWFEYAA